MRINVTVTIDMPPVDADESVVPISPDSTLREDVVTYIQSTLDNDMLGSYATEITVR